MRALLALLALTGPASADCAQWGLTPKVLTAAGAVIPADGGIVVAVQPDPQGKLDNGDPAVQKGWKIRSGSDTLRPPIDTLAPGLAVYRVAMPNSFKVELVDGSGAALVTVKPAHGSGDKLAALKVKKVTFDAKSPDYHGYERLDVELADTPANVLAVIVADDKGTPRSWGSLEHPYEHAACRVLPNGTVPSKKGDTITLLYVDTSGKVSAPTKPIKVE